MPRVHLETVFLVAPWAEALCYGFFLCLFCATMYVSFTACPLGRKDRHSSVMVAVSCIMFLLATLHLVVNCFRLVHGYVQHESTPGGSVAYLKNLSRWDHVLKDTIYATQEIFGNAVAIYRCFVLWDRQWRIIVLPGFLFLVSVASGYTVCVLYTTIDPTATVWNPGLDHWVLTFYSVAVVQNVITTGLMAYRIWTVVRATAAYTASPTILPVSRILIESASLQLLVEVVLLALYAARLNVQYILLECVTPIVGITFIMITMRVKLYRLETFSKQDNTLPSFLAIDDFATKSSITEQFVATRPGSQLDNISV